MEREINIVMALPRQSSVRGCRRVHDEYPPDSISYLCHSPGYCSCRSVFDDLAQCRRSQRQHGSAAGHDRFGSTPSAVATAYRPELINRCAPEQAAKPEGREDELWHQAQMELSAQKSKSVVTQT